MITEENDNHCVCYVAYTNWLQVVWKSYRRLDLWPYP